MFEKDIALVEKARRWARERESSVRSQLSDTAAQRLWGQTHNSEKLNELCQELEEDGINVNQSLVENAAREAYLDIVEHHKERLKSVYDGFEETAVEFATSIYEETEDVEEALTIMQEVVSDVDNREYTSFEIRNIDGYDEFAGVLKQEDGVFYDIKSTSAPSKDEIRENYYPEIPSEAYENFREIFGSEAPIEVTEQKEIQDFE